LEVVVSGGTGVVARAAEADVVLQRAVATESVYRAHPSYSHQLALLRASVAAAAGRLLLALS